MTRKRREGERGFALLMIFAMMAIVAIMLYLELPRAAFEAERTKKEVLIERGEQYQRAIKLFYMKFNRYPGSLDQLENTNNIRFLRRRYKDPMTGKDEWRLIHVVNGMFTDSLTKKAAAVKGVKGTSATDLAQGTPDPNQPLEQQTRAQRWQMLRPGAAGAPSAAQADITGGAGPQAFLPQPSPDQEQYPSSDGQSDPNQQPNQGNVTMVGGFVPGGTNQTGQLQPGQPGYRPQQPDPSSANAGPGPIYPKGITLPGQSTNPALQAINSQLYGPGGQQQNQPQSSSQSNQSSGFTLGAGSQPGSQIAGVASKADGSGIKMYRDHRKYKEWEFIFDPSDPTSGMGPQGPQGVNPQGQPQQNPMQQNPMQQTTR